MVTFHLGDRGASCTLDDQAAAQRNAEFADVFERGLRHRGRTPEGVVRLVLLNEEGMEADIRALAGRESECCGFFSFDADVRDDDIVLQVAASDDKIDYLDDSTGPPTLNARRRTSSGLRMDTERRGKPETRRGGPGAGGSDRRRRGCGQNRVDWSVTNLATARRPQLRQDLDRFSRWALRTAL